jgi:hypothetical protein
VSAPPRFDSVVELPAGAEVLDTALSGDRILFTLDAGGERLVVVHDLATGERLGTVRLIQR